MTHESLSSAASPKENPIIKLIHTGDFHLKAQDDESEYSLSCLKVLIDHANAESVDAVLLCGDMFDKESDYANQDFVQRVVAVLHTAKMALYYIPGNHESQEGNFSRLRTIDFGQKLKLLSEVGLLRFSDKLEILHVPHSPNYDNFTDWTIPVKSTPHRIAMAHGEIPGFTFLGDEDGAGVLNAAIFQHHQVSHVFLGHIHLSEAIKSSGIEFFYAGSPRPVRRKETGTRGYNIITVTDTITIQRRQLLEVGEVKNISTTVLDENWVEDVMLSCHHVQKNDRVQIILKGLVSAEIQAGLKKQQTELISRLSHQCRHVSFTTELEPLADLLENPFYKKVYEVWLSKKPADKSSRHYQVWLQTLHSLKVIKGGVF